MEQFLSKHFIDACKRGSVGEVERYLKMFDHSLIVQPIIDDGFECACTSGHTKVVSILLEHMFDPEKINNGFIFASCHGRLQVVKLLLTDPRVDPTCDNNEAIIYASAYGYKKTVRVLLADPRVNPKGEEAIRVHLDPHNYIEIGIIDNVMFHVVNGRADRLFEMEREIYHQWLYRIGGEKWTQACNSLKE